MDSLKTVILRPGEANRVLSGHPWIYSSSILRLIGEVQDGEQVQVKDHRQRFLGVGVYNAKSKINVRILSYERESIDRSFFVKRIRAALAVRERHLPGAGSFRVINAESDFLSGVIVDKYEASLVLQVSSLGMDIRKSDFVSALQEVLKPAAILERSDVASRKFEGLSESNQMLAGEAPGNVEIDLNGLKFQVELGGGHKTGLYLDQQVNYRKVAERVRPGDHVLDCFSFLGGFALHAARAGAARVHGVDQSDEAVQRAASNAARNGLAEKCRFEAANVFDWLKSQTAAGPNERVIPRFDLIVLDPPSFTRNRASVPDALRGYKEIHLRALKLLKPGGTLATFCCSHHVPAGLFEQVILDAAYDARRVLRRIETYSQSPDHPVLPSVPETEYLKGFAFEVAATIS